MATPGPKPTADATVESQQSLNAQTLHEAVLAETKAQIFGTAAHDSPSMTDMMLNWTDQQLKEQDTILSRAILQEREAARCKVDAEVKQMQNLTDDQLKTHDSHLSRAILCDRATAMKQAVMPAPVTPWQREVEMYHAARKKAGRDDDDGGPKTLERVHIAFGGKVLSETEQHEFWAKSGDLMKEFYEGKKRHQTN